MEGAQAGSSCLGHNNFFPDPNGTNPHLPSNLLLGRPLPLSSSMFAEEQACGIKGFIPRSSTMESIPFCMTEVDSLPTGAAEEWPWIKNLYQNWDPWQMEPKTTSCVSLDLFSLEPHPSSDR